MEAVAAVPQLQAKAEKLSKHLVQEEQVQSQGCPAQKINLQNRSLQGQQQHSSSVYDI